MKGKKVLITGAGKGIGRGIALTFAKAGAELFLHYRSNPDEAESLRREIVGLGGHAVLFRADLSRMAGLDAMFAAVREQWGTLDVAVNNAGWDPGVVALDDIDEKLYYQLTDMNIKGTLFCCLRELELMGRGGSIINLGSVQMNTTVPGRVLYAASKGAIHAMTGALALEAGPRGIRVNTIAPGYIAVERMTARPDFWEEEVAAGIPVRRIGKPEDIGELAVFLASDQAGFISGETIIIDGGVNRKLARFSS
ncbi:MAG: SDR family oxidoreductase [Victivallales bacterium]|nr:SDR family oxidoreductase [Victivallales bacterium]